MNEVLVKKRDSNLELFRIITMLFIIAHHYVVNSGLWEVIRNSPFSRKSIFLLLVGMWGKTGINCFVLITGYFMCKSNITVKKYLKLLLEVYFYKVGIYLIFLCTGYESFSVKKLIQVIMPFTSITTNFTGCFLVFYLFIPFLNVLIRNITEKQHLYLCALCFVIYVLFGSIPKFNIAFNYVTWFSIIYIFASYIRMYPKTIYENTLFWMIMTLIAVIFAILSIIGFLYIGSKVNKFLPDYWLSDSNKIFAVFVSISSFMLFKNLKVKYCNSLINAIAGCTFGVLLIHANSEAMRKLLWQDLLKNVAFYESDYIYVHAVLSVLGIFLICCCIDFIRIKTIETFVLRRLDRLGEKNE